MAEEAKTPETPVVAPETTPEVKTKAAPKAKAPEPVKGQITFNSGATYIPVNA
ncbi:hypothetical protein [Brucella pseudogrignonensis]|uniref:hypothetical protein n=1 Tax=Brucella/Ochrobactrum group TaxID=2826938 RepID=UPI001292C80C|nr:hypothetical protein [Brucella pseudogrignonensis]QWK78607.1 hypothetical protein KMS41_05075 [Ochrobactrum sp. BTU1]